MSAKVIKDGYSAAGFDASGQLKQANLALVIAELPGPRGDVMFVIIGSDFCWIHGLPTGQGYTMTKQPLTGPQSTWQVQIEAYVANGPDESLSKTTVSVGTKTALAQPRLFIISE